MKRISIIIMLLSMTMLLNSCGVMFGGSKYQATIVAKGNPNAEIYVNGKKMGNGQVTTLVPRDQTLKVELKQEGCETKMESFPRKFRTGNFILSIVSWGLIGLGVDLGTGASYRSQKQSSH
jgi:hypothetical protein